MAKYKIIPSSRTIVQSPISIGHKAEKGVEAIEFDLTAWVETYGSGTLTVIMRRWGDAIPYPIALKIDENNKATWTLSDTDTAKAGMAYAQLSYIVGDTVVKKSDIYTFRVMDSLTGEGDPPEAYESWLEHLTHFAAEAMAEVLDIEGIVTDKTLTVDGGIADAKATGEALAEKVDAADYSELSARVGANTIALAEKADQSNTYTKAQVDGLIEDVTVETDTTLEITGAPADAAETGRRIGLIKADLGDVTEFSRYHPLYDYLVLDGDGRVLYDYNAPASPDEITQLERYYPYTLILDKDGYVVFTDKKETVNPLEGLKVSIIGDSISSYEGWVPTGYATYYPRDNVSAVDYMWWKQLLQKSGMTLCVNASWSGSRLGYDITTATNSYSAASDGRIADLVNPDTEETPDIIICYICTNDWGHSTPIGEYSSKMAIPFNGAVTNISQGYALMLYKIRNTYPDALVYCVTHLDGRHSTSGDEDYPIQDDLGQTLHEVNHMIIEIAHVFGARVIDLETCGVHPWNISEYTVDGHLHPNRKGHALIADTMHRQIKHDFE